MRHSWAVQSEPSNLDLAAQVTQCYAAICCQRLKLLTPRRYTEEVGELARQRPLAAREGMPSRSYGHTHCATQTMRRSASARTSRTKHHDATI